MEVDPQQMQEYMDMQQQDQQQQQPMPMLAPQVPSEILELALNYQKILDSLERQLRGEVEELDKETNTRVWTKKHKPLMNHQGISMVVSILKGHISVNTFLTQLTDSEIHEICLAMDDAITTLLANKVKNYEMECVHLDNIFYMITDNIFFALKRAQGALTLRKIHDTTSRIENPMALQQAQARERKGFLGRFF